MNLLASIGVLANAAAPITGATQTIENQVKDEGRKSFNYFWDYANTNEGKGYGLIPDRAKDNTKGDVASIAAVGFGLSTYAVGVENNWISLSEGKERVSKTLDTLLQMQTWNGFFPHFVKMLDGTRTWVSEYSTIDTTLLLNGITVVKNYFNDNEILTKANKIIENVKWKEVIFDWNGKKLVYMGYNPDQPGNSIDHRPHYIYQWQTYAEQLSMYFHIAGATQEQIGDINPLDVYNGFTRNVGSYSGQDNIIYVPTGNLFPYEFSHAWIDTKHLLDPNGVDWFNNSQKAINAGIDWVSMVHWNYKGAKEADWGISAGDGPNGYNANNGVPPLGVPPTNVGIWDGTCNPYAIVGALEITKEQSLDSLNFIFNDSSRQNVTGKYGLYDGYNYEGNTPWIDTDYIGIDKGLEVLAIDNTLFNGVTHKYFMMDDKINKAITTLHFTNK